MIKYILAFLLLASNVSAQCGVERAKVKQLRDTLTLSEPTLSTIGEISKLPLVKVGNNTERSALERQVFSVSATLVGYKLEADRDIHMVIRDSGKTMIIESIDPACTELKGNPYLPLFQDVRAWIGKNLPKPTPKFRKVNIPITVVGLLFEDKIHGQTGVAKNGYEIHPLFSIAPQSISVSASQ